MSWSRKLYFFVEKLHISAAERNFMIILMLLLTCTTLFRIWMEPQGGYAPEYYEELHEALEARERQMMAARREILMRYGTLEEGGSASGSNELASLAAISREHRLSEKQRTVHVLADSSATDADTTQGEAPGTFPQPHDSDKNTGNDKQVLINKASVDALTQLPGIGPVIAGRIVQYRMEHGPFKSADELRKVKGIGEKRLEDILPYIKL